MEPFIFLLLVLLLILWVVHQDSKKDFQKKERRYLDRISDQEQQLKKVTQEKNDANAKAESYAKEVTQLRTQLDRATRALDFYKNIEEDSGSLNAPKEDPEIIRLLDVAAQQIREERSQSSTSSTMEHATLLLDTEQCLACDEMEHSCSNFLSPEKPEQEKASCWIFSEKQPVKTILFSHRPESQL